MGLTRIKGSCSRPDTWPGTAVGVRGRGFTAGAGASARRLPGDERATENVERRAAPAGRLGQDGPIQFFVVDDRGPDRDAARHVAASEAAFCAGANTGRPVAATPICAGVRHSLRGDHDRRHDAELVEGGQLNRLCTRVLWKYQSRQSASPRGRFWRTATSSHDPSALRYQSLDCCKSRPSEKEGS